MNSGVAMAEKIIAHLRSLRCRPGAMNAHNWYSQIGLARIRPNSAEILIRNVSALPTPGKVSSGIFSLPPSLASAATLVTNGLVRNSNAWL